MAKLNLTGYSLPNAKFPKGSSAGNCNTDFSSKKGLAKVNSGTQRRAPEYTLESQKK